MITLAIYIKDGTRSWWCTKQVCRTNLSREREILAAQPKVVKVRQVTA